MEVRSLNYLTHLGVVPNKDNQMHAKYKGSTRVAYFDPVTERCPECDGHWKCYCRGTCELTMDTDEVEVLKSLMTKVSLADINEEETKLAKHLSETLLTYRKK